MYKFLRLLVTVDLYVEQEQSDTAEISDDVESEVAGDTVKNSVT